MCTGSVNTRLHQLRQPALLHDGSLSLNGVSIVVGPHAAHRNPASGDCHPGSLDRHTGVYITKASKPMRSHSPDHHEASVGNGNTGSIAPRQRIACLQNSLVRTPRCAGLGPGLSAKRPGVGPPGSRSRSPADREGDDAFMQHSPREHGMAVGMLSKAGSFPALKSLNESLQKVHVDRGDFIPRAFVPSHPNSQYAARIPADYETFAGSMDKWAAGPGGGVEGMRGHVGGSWQDVHAPGTRPFPAPLKTALELNLKLLPQSITTTDVSHQQLSCGATRKRPLTARDRYPVPTGNTPRRYALRPQTAREHTSAHSSEDGGGVSHAHIEIPIADKPRSKEPSLVSSLAEGSIAHTRRALEVMRMAHRPLPFRAEGVPLLDVRGNKVTLSEREAFSQRPDGKENEQGKTAFNDEKDRGVVGIEISSPRSPPQNLPRGGGGRGQPRPHTAKIKTSVTPKHKETNDSTDSERQKARDRHDFLNKVSNDIELFSGRTHRPTTAPTKSQLLTAELHAKLEVRNAYARRTFRIMDNDHDGVVNACDMAHGLDVLNIPATHDEIADMLSDYRQTGQGGEQGMVFAEYARDIKRIRFPSQNPFEGKAVTIPFWKPKDAYLTKWDGEYGKGVEGSGERVRTKLEWRHRMPAQRDIPVCRIASPRGCGLDVCV